MRLPQDQEQKFVFEKRLQQLSFDNMVKCLRTTIANFPDKRTRKNTRYSLEDAALGAFSVFFTQSRSFLSFQNSMQKTKGKSNAQTLFAMDKIPSDNHIRDLLDVVAPELVFPVFHYILGGIQDSGQLDAFRCYNGNLVSALDGTLSLQELLENLKYRAYNPKKVTKNILYDNGMLFIFYKI